MTVERNSRPSHTLLVAHPHDRQPVRSESQSICDFLRSLLSSTSSRRRRIIVEFPAETFRSRLNVLDSSSPHITFIPTRIYVYRYTLRRSIGLTSQSQGRGKISDRAINEKDELAPAREIVFRENSGPFVIECVFRTGETGRGKAVTDYRCKRFADTTGHATRKSSRPCAPRSLD